MILGSVYGLMTMGLSLIFGVLKIVNVGHGAFMMVGAYVAFWMFRLFGLSPILAIPVALGVGMALGYCCFQIVIRRLTAAPELTTLLATFAIGIFLEESARFFLDPTTGALAGTWDASCYLLLRLFLWERSTRSSLASSSLCCFTSGSKRGGPAQRSEPLWRTRRCEGLRHQCGGYLCLELLCGHRVDSPKRKSSDIIRAGGH